MLGAKVKVVLFNYRAIADDILNGQGAYLDALFLQLNVLRDRRAAALAELRIILNDKRHPASFAIAVAATGCSGP